MDRVLMHGKMEQSIQVNSKQGKEMDLVFGNHRVTILTAMKVNMLRIWNMEKEFISGEAELFTKENSKTIWSMAQESSHMRTVKLLFYLGKKGKYKRRFLKIKLKKKEKTFISFQTEILKKEDIRYWQDLNRK